MLVYLFAMPAMLNVLGIYSVCNIDDVSWGNRPEKSDPNAELTEKEKKVELLNASYKKYKWAYLIKYLVWNIVIIILIVFPFSAF